MAEKLVAGHLRDVVWCEQREVYGDMFPAEVGVWRDDSGFVAYVTDGWGGGINSRPHLDEELARADIGRLWEKFYG